MCTRNTSRRRSDNEYEARAIEIEGASFCPIVIATTGGQAHGTRGLVKRLSVLLADKMEHTSSLNDGMDKKPDWNGGHKSIHHVPQRIPIPLQGPHQSMGPICD